MINDFADMRDFMRIATEYSDIGQTPIDLYEAAPPPVEPSGPPLARLLEDVIFKLRAYGDPGEGDLALGIETGMQQAADMLENALRRHEEGI